MSHFFEPSTFTHLLGESNNPLEESLMETVHWGGGAGDKNDGKVPAQYNSSEQKTVKTTENEARLWQTAIRDGLDK